MNMLLSSTGELACSWDIAGAVVGTQRRPVPIRSSITWVMSGNLPEAAMLVPELAEDQFVFFFSPRVSANWDPQPISSWFLSPGADFANTSSWAHSLQYPQPGDVEDPEESTSRAWSQIWSAEANVFLVRHSRPEESSCWPETLLETSQPTVVWSEPSWTLETKAPPWGVNQHLIMKVSYSMSKWKTPYVGHHPCYSMAISLPGLALAGASQWSASWCPGMAWRAASTEDHSQMGSGGQAAPAPALSSPHSPPSVPHLLHTPFS